MFQKLHVNKFKGPVNMADPNSLMKKRSFP